LTINTPWAGVVIGFGLGLLGLWWMLAPKATIGFYRALGNRQFERLGPTGVRILGIFPLALGAAFLAIAIFKQY
jgi:hypothetical protein